MRLTRLGGRAGAWLISAIVAFSVLAVAPTDRDSLRKVLADAWPILATWLPAIFLILSILLSNSDKLFHKALSRTGRIQFLIADIWHAACSILVTIIALVALDLHFPEATPGWLVSLSLWLLVFSIGLCFFVARTLVKIAKAVHDHAATTFNKQNMR